MKQPVVASVIEFSSKLIMVNTNNILAAFAITFLASLSLSSVYAKHNLDIPNTFEKHFDHELRPFLREKREKEAEVFHLKNNNPLELEEESLEPKSIYERRTLGEEAKDVKNSKEQEKLNIEPKTNNNIVEEEEDAQDDVFSYRSMHDLIQALILADEEDIAERLQQLRENTTKSERFSNLPKRQVIASAAAAAAAAVSNGLVGANPWDAVPLVDLDAHSCEVEAFSHGHFHVSGTIVHEFFCELRKFWHYGLIVLRNLRSGLSLGPLIAEDASDNILGHLFHHTSHLLHVVIKEPHHLLILPDIIQDAVPFPSIIGAIHRLKHVFFKVLHFGIDLFRTHIRHVLAHLFSHLRLSLHHLGRFSSVLPLEEIVTEPIVSTAASAASAASTAAATTAAAAAAAAATTGDSSIIVPDYQTSLAEVLSSFRGFYHGYHASGLPHLIRTGVRGIALPSAFSRIGSYLSRIPLCGNFGYGPIEQSTTVTTSSASSASSSVAIGSVPVVSPVIKPIAPVVPIGTEIASSSASATATATATVAETQPVFSAEPTIMESPIVSGYPTASLIQPEVVPSILEDNVVTASAAAASSAANVLSTPVAGRVPFTLPLRKYRPSLSTVAPAAATVAAAASASASTGGDRTVLGPSTYRGLDLDIDRRIKYPLIRSRVLPVVVPSSAAASSAAASAAASAATSAAASTSSAAVASSSAISSGGFNIVLPREQIVSALGYDYLLPGDIISVTLKNKSILFGRVLDTTSPITFSFLRPKIRASLLHHGGRVWKLLPRDFRNPECYKKFNNPLLLRYSL
ncbi:hypothetical protein ALC53_10227 [Atta colombica]|uniref:Uncharacterized protein n=1 Tax=Atta colombica TaxID=520822 RepID=A0A151I0H3_9HYME|nr:PREDICTED: uncharacterized protein LOC108690268 [Atta colombica]KYM79332.1 hypothetical protein ALC53_10227 [Atta colombica]